MMRRILLVLCMILTLSGVGGIAARPASAQITEGLEAISETIRLPSTDPRVIAARIINVVLGLLGIIFVVLILYAGFLYMTSGGDAGKVDKAVGIIRNAVIGLIVILCSWAITTYIIHALLAATQDGGGGGGGGDGGPGGGLGSGGASQSFQVVSMTPQGSVPLRNVQVRVVLNRAVDDSTVSAITVSKNGTDVVAGTLAVSGSVVTFTPSTACPAPNESRYCFDGDSNFTVRIGATLRSVSGQTISCGGFALACQATFQTGNLVDTQPPSATITFPTDGMSIPVNSLQDFFVDARDDSGVSLVEGFEGGSNVIGVDAPSASSTVRQFSANLLWNTAGASLGRHSLSARASDIDTNTAMSNAVTVAVRPAHCFNGQLDAAQGETGIDCGGDANSAEYCGVCSGGSCTANADCSSGFCQAGVCVERPVITTVSPADGAPGTFVTVSGINFGSSRGTVVFLGDPANPADDREAQAPAVCSAAGIGTWSNTQVVVAVPDATASGPIQIRNSGSNLTDRTDQDPGPQIPDFLANDIVRPGLCGLTPAEGRVNEETDAVGQAFGPSPSTVLFGETTLSSFSSWTESRVRVRVPVVNSGPTRVSVFRGSLQSNAVIYTVRDRATGAAPVIDYIDPERGPQGEYVTVSGRNFGFAIGNIRFRSDVSGVIVNGDDTFPAECGSQYWRDDHVVIKVPAIANGTYRVQLVRPDGAVTNEVPFERVTGTPKPGICAISPPLGPVATPVRIIGDNFGSSTPVVTFSSRRLAAVTLHNNALTQTTVPVGSVTGPVTVASGASVSNRVNFQVMNCNESPDVCGPANQYQCCPTGECRLQSESCQAASLTAEYAWQTSTGLIPVAPRVIEECSPNAVPAPTPSPSPWSGRAGGDQAPVNADIVMRFSRTLARPVRHSSFLVLRCTGTGSNPCSQTTDESNQFADPVVVAENNTQDTVTLSRLGSQALAVNTTYQVKVVSDIRAAGAGGAAMDVMTSCGRGPNNQTYGYCFTFRTRATQDPGTVGSVSVIPNTFTMHTSGEETSYRAQPIDTGDRCVVLRCSDHQWNWYTGTPANADGRAGITNVDRDFDGNIDCVQTGTGYMETGSAPVEMNARLLTTSFFGRGLLYISFIPPHVEAYGPNCDLACSNAQIWARFSSELDRTSVLTPGNVELHKCFNENCYETDPFPLIAARVELVPPGQGDEDRQVNISPLQPLDPGGFYRVILRGGPSSNRGIQGLNGVPMARLNHASGFAWTFRVKTGADAVCTADRVDMVPVQKIETDVSGRQLFVASAYSKPDTCSADGQALVPTGAAWRTQNASIADLYRIRSALVDTTSQLPLGCTANCLATGASGRYGRVAVCGNGTIETTDATFCRNGTTPTGRACTVMAVGTQAGEECEPGVDGVDVCDQNSCLYRPVAAFGLGGTCGDGIVQRERGEACDFGATCVGGSSATSSAPVAELSSCQSQAARDACTRAGGTCGFHEVRGCSASCRFMGATAGNSTCGNSDLLGDGKACDDGNTTSRDGCSSQCLHEGSLPATQIVSVCGNARLEPGEACERTAVNAAFPSGCSATTCLHTGTVACTDQTDPRCCGNGQIEPGEDCDDRNHAKDDGCSGSCLFEGSSAYYNDVNGHMSPSFCGNGMLEQGEQCEVNRTSAAVATAIAYPGAGASIASIVVNQVYSRLNPVAQTGDGLVDSIQLAYISQTVVPDVQTGVASTTLTATILQKDGSANYGLQCGYTSESSCAAGFGLDDNGCCRERPEPVTKYPVPSSTGVCRNVQLSAFFNVGMRAETVTANFEVAQQAAVSCPQGTQELIVRTEYKGGIVGWMQKAWDLVVSAVTGKPVFAQRWCMGMVTGQLQPTSSDKAPTGFVYNLDTSLAANTRYIVRFVGDDSLADNNVVANKKGIKSFHGVVQPNTPGYPGPLVWTFTTGNDICTVNNVRISDVTTDPVGAEHPYVFINPGNAPETRYFSAAAESIQNGQPVPLSPIPDVYAWSWDPWTTSNRTIVGVSADHDQSADVTSLQKNGNAILTATIVVNRDTVSSPSTVGQAVSGIAPVTVQVCENPWPTLTTSPFRDMEGSVNFRPGDPFYRQPPHNFGTMYCMDANKSADTSDDLPQLQISQVPLTTQDQANNILRQYLFVYGSDHPELKQDGIGIRIMTNPQHLSPMEWYKAQGFTGSPKVTTVDGYPAIEDGATTYIAATNRPQGSRGNIYSNIYIISRNPDASETTRTIFGQMVNNMVFNINREFADQSNTCRTSSNGVYHASGTNAFVSCTADWECLQHAPNLYCDSTKAKLTRDSIRIADFQAFSSAMEAGKDQLGRYPQANAGTYLRGLSTSLWPSWNEEIFRDAPKDPVNRLLTCGQCSVTHVPCMTDTDCPADNGTAQTCKGGRMTNGQWVEDAGIDPATCWNSTSRQFICPRIGTLPTGVSRLYRYTSQNGGLEYQLAAEFEVPPPTTPTQNWWSPALPNGVYRCVSTSTYGQACSNSAGTGGNDALCAPRSCAGSTLRCSTDQDCVGIGGAGGGSARCVQARTQVGACRRFAGNYIYSNLCPGTGVYGEGGTCGDGVLNTGEVCEIGQTQSVACSTTGTGANNGHRLQTCVACQRFADDLQNPQCIADVVCGNGRRDAGEVCDDGALNGTYGHCSRTCRGVGGFCGDGQLSPGETCDNGVSNGVDGNGDYNSSCSLDCQTSGPYCGDGRVDGPEQCDGAGEVSAGALCFPRPGNAADSRSGNPCTAATAATDCGPNNTCGGGSVMRGVQFGTRLQLYEGDARPRRYDSCAGIYVTDLNGQRRATQHVRTCNSSCRRTGSASTNPGGWSACIAVGVCGDGAQDLGEECDDGDENSDNGSCTTQCRRNSCGDGNVQEGVEECDAGANNGSTTCSADYNSSCLSCSTLCKWQATAGGYCGDGQKNGAEQCDSRDGVTDPQTLPTCAQLGFDYGTASCNTSCGFNGCLKCSETRGTGTLIGYVRDAVYINQPVPNARVSLLYKGTKVDEAISNASGRFTFTQVNTNAACSSYRVVVDYYNDNPNTATVDESVNGGYWSYTSNVFRGTQERFEADGLEQTEPYIYLLPRVSRYETLVFANWTGGLNGYVDAHLVVPQGAAFQHTRSGSDSCSGPSYTYTSCSGANCTRDIHWNIPGLHDLTTAPHGRLFCYRLDSSCEQCQSFSTGPQVFKFSRANIGAGSFDFYMNDYGRRYQRNGAYANINLQVTVVDVDEVRVMLPPSGFGDGWHVFSQRAEDGFITAMERWRTRQQMANSGAVGLWNGQANGTPP